MDAPMFDRLAQSLTTSPSRRAAVRFLAGMPMIGLWRIAPDALAKRKKRKKKKCTGGKKKCGKKCFDLQTDPLHCGNCGTHCDDDMECRGGHCRCPENETECGEGCCASGQNCVDGQCAEDLCPPDACPSGQTCVDGECVCPEGETPCADACCEVGLACVDGQCKDLCPPELVCLLGQVCVDGDCTCPATACAAATDPTDDQFELCSCDMTIEGDQVCLASLACSSNPPPCTSSAECAAGSVCQASSCGGIARCNPMCSLS